MTWLSTLWNSAGVNYLLAVVIIILSILLGFLVRSLLKNRLSKWMHGTHSSIDNILFSGLSTPIVLWFTAIGFYISIRIMDLPEKYETISSKTVLVLIIFSITLVAMGVVSQSLKAYLQRQGARASTRITQNVIKIIILSIGIMIILNSLGISITPLITTLGIGGLAVALALQDTLSNLFSGFHLTLAGEIHVGDYIKLESGEGGYVTDISWRTTQIRLLPNNYVLIPNAKLAQTIITNYYLNDMEMSVPIQMGVHYDSDLDKVERITIEVARDVLKTVEGGVKGFDPVIRYHTFDSSSINFTVVLRTSEFVGQYLLKHEFVKRIHKRYKEEGIVIPYPIHAINFDQEKAVSHHREEKSS